MKIGIEKDAQKLFHLEETEEGIVLVDSDGYNILELKVDNVGKIYAATCDDIDEEAYSLRKGHTDIEVIK